MPHPQQMEIKKQNKEGRCGQSNYITRNAVTAVIPEKENTNCQTYCQSKS
jgi:hypothetical protein